MQISQPPPRENAAVESTVTIGRPVDEVFAFYRDFRNLPRFLGDVMSVELDDAMTSRWTVQGPLALLIHWTITVTTERPNELIRYEIAGTKASWEISFGPGSDPRSTVVREVMRTPFGRLGRAALLLIGRFPAAEVSANLRRLKQLLETGRVTDTAHAVAGKFDGR